VEFATSLAADRVLPQQPGQRAKEASDALRNAGGEHVWLDVAAVASSFSAFTILVDSTGQRNAAVAVVAPMLTGVVNVKRRVRWMLPILGGVAAVAAAVYMAKSLRRM